MWLAAALRQACAFLGGLDDRRVLVTLERIPHDASGLAMTLIESGVRDAWSDRQPQASSSTGRHRVTAHVSDPDAPELPASSQISPDLSNARHFPKPINELVSAMRPVLEQSVDELDTSVALEVSGINDHVAASRFGSRDVAHLALQLTESVPARVWAVEATDRPRPTATIRLACRGLLFGIPGLFYLVVTRASPGAAESYTMVTAMLAGWGLSQGIALLAYRVLGRGGPSSAASMLRIAMAGFVAAAGVGVLTAVVLQQVWLVSLAAGQLLYVVAATVLLFYNADRVLLLALTPGAVISIFYLTTDRLSAHICLSAVAFTVVLACGAALWRAHLAIGDQPVRARVVRADVRIAMPYVLQGILSGIVVALIPLQMLFDSSHVQAHPVDLSIIPLVLCMGFAEIELLRLRTSGGQLMGRTLHLADYRRGVRGLLLSSQTRFMTIVLLASAVVGVLTATISDFTSRDLILLSAYAILGPALLAALVLSAVDRVSLALVGFGLSAVAIAAIFGLVLLLGYRLTVETGYLIGCVVLLALLTSVAIRVLRDPRVLA